jgi:hypothetical protein
MAEPKRVFDWQIAEILDKTTVVIKGTGLESLDPGDELSIVAIGPILPSIGVPLVVQKADLVVDSASKYYAIAKTPQYEVTVEGLPALTGFMGPRKEWRRDALKVDEKQVVGNPAWKPVAVGIR